MQSKTYDYLFKLLLIGDIGVGKPALISSFVDTLGQQQEGKIAIGVDFIVCSIEIEGKKIKLQIWDTAGQERFRTITAAYYRGAKGILLVYDITRRETLAGLNNWFKRIRENAPEDVQIMLLGNKCETEDMRQVSTELGTQWANEHGVKFMEVSAKENINVYDAFVTLARDIMAVQEPKRVAEERKRDAAACQAVSEQSSDRKCNIL